MIHTLNVKSWQLVLKTCIRSKMMNHKSVIHIMILRGLDFRPAYRKVAGLQSVTNTCTLVLTATATRKIQEDIYTTLGFETDTTKVVAVLPDRYAGLLPNSFFLFNLTTINCNNNSKLKISLPL